METKIFWLRSFFGSFFKISWIKKWPNPKKLLKQKISFFMLVNHAKEFLKFVHNEALFLQLFVWASSSVHIATGTLTSKLFDLISVFWQDLPKNTIAGWIRDNRSHPNTQILILIDTLWTYSLLILCSKILRYAARYMKIAKYCQFCI